jgi:Flp pilus assembly protein TadD
MSHQGEGSDVFGLRVTLDTVVVTRHRGTAVVGAALLATCAACAPTSLGRRPAAASASSQAPAGKHDVQVIVGPGAMEDGDAVLGAWLAYGTAKAAAYDKQPPPAANESGDDFALELAGRQAQCDFWAARRAEGAPRHADLDRQLEICRAGFLPELVVSLHARPGWTIPAKVISSLRVLEFVERFAGNYTPGAPIMLKTRSGNRYPDVPGADFPDQARLPVGPSICGTARAERAAAWTRWSRIEPTLGGVPVSATTTMHFARQLAAIKTDARYARGVTWVSDRVAHLAMVDGFCAVEEKDWPRARDLLTRAALLDPSDPGPLLELGVALTHLHEYDQALATIDRILSSGTDDGCTVGRALRQRGYVLFEQGALDAARATYEQSLKVDPDNSIALRELQSLAAARQQHGSLKARGAFVPPPSLGTVVTTCRKRAD